MILSRSDKARIQEAIREAEKGTSAEIRVHVRLICWGDPLQEARRVFARLGMHRTRGRNAVLIFVALGSHKFAVVGDQAIHQAAGDVLWKEVTDVMQKHLLARQTAQAFCEAVARIGKDLKKWFPADGENPNELTDEVSL